MRRRHLLAALTCLGVVSPPAVAAQARFDADEARRQTLRASCDGEGDRVGGRVLDLLTLVPLYGAVVDIVVAGDGGDEIRTVRAGTDGSYAACLPEGAAREVRARVGSDHGRPVTLRPADGPVFLKDLFVQVAEPATLTGRVRDGSTGDPMDDASVQLLGTRLATATGADGRFTFRGVPPGDVEVAVERIGYGRQVVTVSAEGGSTVELALDVFPEAVALDSVVVSVKGGTVERRRTGSRFDGMDRPQIEKLLIRSRDFASLLRMSNIPGLKIREATYQESSGLRYPGVCIETGRTSTIHSDQCYMVAVYLNDVLLPDAETFLRTLNPDDVERFQILSRTEAGVQYSGTPDARNGVLLIYTRGR